MASSQFSFASSVVTSIRLISSSLWACVCVYVYLQLIRAALLQLFFMLFWENCSFVLQGIVCWRQSCDLYCFSPADWPTEANRGRRRTDWTGCTVGENILTSLCSMSSRTVCMSNSFPSVATVRKYSRWFIIPKVFCQSYLSTSFSLTLYLIILFQTDKTKNKNTTDQVSRLLDCLRLRVTEVSSNCLFNSKETLRKKKFFNSTNISLFGTTSINYICDSIKTGMSWLDLLPLFQLILLLLLLCTV